jgi:hypothetical protein
MGRAQAHCRLKRRAPGIQLNEVTCATTGAARLVLSGVATCKSPLCPLCAPTLMRRRTADITQALNVWDPWRSWFATFTVRHNKRMPIALLHRLLTLAFGNLFAGRKGGELARELGGPLVRSPAPSGLPDYPPAKLRALKPHSIRAHDRTWSSEHHWHPHLHALLFLHEQLDGERLRELLTARWKDCAAGALAALKDVCRRAMWTAPLARGTYGPIMEETDELRSRCEKVIGKRIFRPERSLADAARPLAKALEGMTTVGVVPYDRYAVVAEQVRGAGATARYLSKLGCELSGMGAKSGNTVFEPSGRVVTHYGLWQLAGIACSHGHELRQRARAAWAELFHATLGTQTLTWSQGARKAFGLGERQLWEEAAQAELDQEHDGAEPSEPTDTTRVIGEIAGHLWDPLARRQRQGLLATLHAAHQLGAVAELPYVCTEGFSPSALAPHSVERRAPDLAPPPELAEQRGRERSRAPPPVPLPRAGPDSTCAEREFMRLCLNPVRLREWCAQFHVRITEPPASAARAGPELAQQAELPLGTWERELRRLDRRGT